jgi:hypothetical protein
LPGRRPRDGIPAPPWTEQEIAAALGCTRAFVRTRLQRIRQRLEELSDDEAGQPAELGDKLKYCLAAPASEYLTIRGRSTEFPADSPSGSAAAAMTLGEMLPSADPPLGLLIAVRRHAKRLMKPGASDVPAGVHEVVYFASVAAALVRRGQRISKSSPEVSRAAWHRLAAESYLDDGLRKLFAEARQRLFGQGGGG